MEINKHVCFRLDEAPRLINYLQQNNIEYEMGEIISSIDLYESSPHWAHISECVEQEKLLCHSETVFTKQELQNAEWLTMRSQWRFDYPQPEGDFDYENITYTRQNYCPECSSRLVQVNPFRIKNPPKWGRRHFAELNWVGDELFVSDTAKSIFEGHNISGISFMKVQDKAGKEFFTDISQLIIHNIIDEGLFESKASIREINTCPNCGITKYLLSGIGMLAFQRKIFDNQPDIVKTGDLFGSGHYAARTIVVRQTVYQTIIQNNLERGLVFEPIELL
jgi:hypothetical protein